jgi:hypothetical protein
VHDQDANLLLKVGRLEDNEEGKKKIFFFFQKKKKDFSFLTNYLFNITIK